jgi:N utilization substance protein B
MQKRAARELALKSLYKSEFLGYETALDFSFEERATKESKDYAKLLVKGVVDNVSYIDKLIKEFSINWDIRRISIIDKNILRVAIYEMVNKLAPPKVVINEALELAKKYSEKKAPKFINGILDAIKKKFDL